MTSQAARKMYVDAIAVLVTWPAADSLPDSG